MASNMNTTSDDRLKTAAQEGDIDLLYTVIQEDPYILDHLDLIPFVETPLHIAASFGHLRFATEIMRLKPSFAWKLNQQGFSPIHLAMQNGQKRMVFRFVDINKDLIRVKGREGLTPLHFATSIGEIDILANFLLVCPESIEDVTVRSETALHMSVRYQQYETLQVLIGWLKTTRQKDAMQLEETILNWKDDAGNTVLHISALMNNSKALRLLLKTKMDLEAKNLENSTALDTAGSEEIKSILVKAGVKRGSSIIDAPSLSDKLRWNMLFMDKIVIFILRIRRDITEGQRNSFLIVAALVATATYQSALSPPGGVYQADVGDNSLNSNSFKYTATSTITQRHAGSSVLSEADFFVLMICNAFSFLVSTITIYILTPSGIVGNMLFRPVFWFVTCYFYSMAVVSPTVDTTIFSISLFLLFGFFYLVADSTFTMVNKRLQGNTKNKEIETRSGRRGNRW